MVIVKALHLAGHSDYGSRICAESCQRVQQVQGALLFAIVWSCNRFASNETKIQTPTLRLQEYLIHPNQYIQRVLQDSFGFFASHVEYQRSPQRRVVSWRGRPPDKMLQSSLESTDGRSASEPNSLKKKRVAKGRLFHVEVALFDHSLRSAGVAMIRIRKHSPSPSPASFCPQLPLASQCVS